MVHKNAIECLDMISASCKSDEFRKNLRELRSLYLEELSEVQKDAVERRKALKANIAGKQEYISRLRLRVQEQYEAAAQANEEVAKLRSEIREVQGQLAGEISAQQAVIESLQAHRGYYLRNRPNDFEKGMFDELVQKVNFVKVEREAVGADATFVSLSKSGRTWVRFFLQHYAELAYGTPFDVRLNSVQGFERYNRLWLTEDFFDYYLHEDRATTVVYRNDIRRRPMVLMMRDPRDAIVSMYHWLTSHRQVFGSGGISMRDFVSSPIYGIERASDFVVQLHELFQEHPGPKHIMTYEQCWADTHLAFKNLLIFLSGKYDAGLFEEAVFRSSFKQMQQREMEICRSGDLSKFSRMGVADWNGNVNSLKVRRGGVDNYKDEAPWIDSLIRTMPRTRELVSIIDSYRPE